jgi:Fic-DOC domain mobile mystery protein B
MNDTHELSINKNLPIGATELSIDDLNGLIPDYISIRKELDEFEKANIARAIIWLRKKKFLYTEVLTLKFIFELHKRMFDKTWKWAGILRTQAVNIGNTPIEQIQMRVKDVLDNVIYWIENKTFSEDEICIRLHHKLVWIHPFPNGNGRFSRIICDELRRSLGYELFSWGGTDIDLVEANENRKLYILALRVADRGDYRLLLDFVKR